MPILYIVSTPIGNLEDLTLRALRILKEVDLILCEDTRTTEKLLSHYRIEKPTLSYHRHSELKKINEILGLLRQGKNLALVSDAGTPGISDPGNKLVSQILESLANEVKIVPLPGPAALTCGASIAGFPMDRFLFLGFVPSKRKRKKFFEEILNSKFPAIFYESPHRILKTLEEMKDIFQNSGFAFQAVVCRELTKKFETIYRGPIEKIITEIKMSDIRGEFTVIVNKTKKL